MKIRLMAQGQDYEALQLGVFSPKAIEVDELGVGEVGFLVANIKNVGDAKIGDTITETARPTRRAVPGLQRAEADGVRGSLSRRGPSSIAELRDALEKLRLNDASFFYEPETSAALGFGFRCGFLGLLHMEIVQERLEREFNMDLITTAPSVLYRVTTTDGEVQEIDSPAKLPDAGRIKVIEEPVITAMILTPAEYVGGILQLCQDKRGVQKTLEYLASDRVLVTYELPFNEVVLDFYDKLKTISRGYASLDYHVTGYWPSPLVKLDILVNGDPVDALSIIVHRDMAYERGRALAAKMRELIPRQMFEVAIQAAIGGRIIARETIKAHAQERAREVLRRRHHAQAQAAREAEGRQEADEAGRQGRNPAGSVSGRAEDGHGLRRTDGRSSSRSRRFASTSSRSSSRSSWRSSSGRSSSRRSRFPTGSMENNLLIGDHLLVNKFVVAPTTSGSSGRCCRSATIKRGDVLVFKYPVEPDRDFIKRVIGLPGETLQLKDKKIYINGKPLDEPYVHFLEAAARERRSSPRSPRRTCARTTAR